LRRVRALRSVMADGMTSRTLDSPVLEIDISMYSAAIFEEAQHIILVFVDKAAGGALHLFLVTGE